MHAPNTPKEAPALAKLRTGCQVWCSWAAFMPHTLSSSRAELCEPLHGLWPPDWQLWQKYWAPDEESKLILVVVETYISWCHNHQGILLWIADLSWIQLLFRCHQGLLYRNRRTKSSRSACHRAWSMGEWCVDSASSRSYLPSAKHTKSYWKWP